MRIYNRLIAGSIIFAAALTALSPGIDPGNAAGRAEYGKGLERVLQTIDQDETVPVWIFFAAASDKAAAFSRRASGRMLKRGMTGGALRPPGSASVESVRPFVERIRHRSIRTLDAGSQDDR